MTKAVQVCGLKKSYGTHAVLKGLNFGVNQGEIFGILGVNGAGKTTAMDRSMFKGKPEFSCSRHHCRSISGRWRRSGCLQSGITVCRMREC